MWRWWYRDIEMVYKYNGGVQTQRWYIDVDMVYGCENDGVQMLGWVRYLENNQDSLIFKNL